MIGIILKIRSPNIRCVFFIHYHIKQSAASNVNLITQLCFINA